MPAGSSTFPSLVISEILLSLSRVCLMLLLIVVSCLDVLFLGFSGQPSTLTRKSAFRPFALQRWTLFSSLLRGWKVDEMTRVQPKSVEMRRDDKSAHLRHVCSLVCVHRLQCTQYAHTFPLSLPLPFSLFPFLPSPPSPTFTLPHIPVGWVFASSGFSSGSI